MSTPIRTLNPGTDRCEDGSLRFYNYRLGWFFVRPMHVRTAIRKALLVAKSRDAYERRFVATIVIASMFNLPCSTIHDVDAAYVRVQRVADRILVSL